jgi:ankyrin repeat protein
LSIDNFSPIVVGNLPRNKQQQMSSSPLLTGRRSVTVAPQHLSKLHAAVRNLDIPRLREFLKDGVDVNVKGSRGWTPLHRAAEMDDLEAARFFIHEAGEMVDVDNDDGETPLICASRRGCVKMVDFLVKNGADIELESNLHRTAVHEACEQDQLECLRYFIEKREASIDLETENETTPLYYAIKNNNSEMVKYCLSKKASLEKESCKGDIPLHFAIHKARVEIVRVLVEVGNADVNAPGSRASSSFYVAAREGNLELVKYLAWKGSYHTPWEWTLYFDDEVSTERRTVITNYARMHPFREAVLALMSGSVVKRLGVRSILRKIDPYLLRSLYSMLAGSKSFKVSVEVNDITALDSDSEGAQSEQSEDEDEEDEESDGSLSSDEEGEEEIEDSAQEGSDSDEDHEFESTSDSEVEVLN